MARILVVDDEEMMLRLIRRILADHTLVCELDAQRALDAIAGGTRHDLILCDLSMPRMSGMEFHAALTQVAPDQAERIVFLTGGAYNPDAQAFLERIPNARASKPFNPTGLKALIAAELAKLSAGGR